MPALLSWECENLSKAYCFFMVSRENRNMREALIWSVVTYHATTASPATFDACISIVQHWCVQLM